MGRSEHAWRWTSIAVAGLVALGPATTAAQTFDWTTVVNNNDLIPGTERNFNSYNQPSVNSAGVVVFRARSRGGQTGGPARGIFTRDMSMGDVSASPIETIADGTTLVPDPKNRNTTFIEFPSIPRIARGENAVATRGNHEPVLRVSDTNVGTSGIYVDLDVDSSSSALLTGASKLGSVEGFEFYEVPGAPPGTFFDVFPGSPSITDDGTIAFKGNYTELDAKTGVYYRELEDAVTGGTAPVQLIANSDTPIPDLPASVDRTFGSTAPPSADGGQMVFVGLDDEANPSFGGIYLAPLAQPPALTTLVAIGAGVPGTRGMTFNRLGEGLSFDGRFVAFWGAWGDQTRTLPLDCPTEGNQDRITFCLDGFDNFEVQVPLDQGIFVHDIATGRTHMVARTGDGLDDFLFWNFSGRVPGDESEDDGEPARWRSSAFVAVSRRAGATANVAFKARTGEIDPIEQNYVDPIDGIYLKRTPGQSRIITVLDTTTAGVDLDPEAPENSAISELGIEREALRGDWLVLNARMGEEGGEEEEGLAGIYLTRLR